jgi:hypothetical protein
MFCNAKTQSGCEIEFRNQIWRWPQSLDEFEVGFVLLGSLVVVKQLKGINVWTKTSCFDVIMFVN